MPKITLHPLFPSSGPFGGEPITFDVPNDPIPASGSFKFAPLPGFLPATTLPTPETHPFAALGEGPAGSTKFEKIKLAHPKSDDYFAGLGSSDAATSTSTRSDGFRFAPFKKGNDYFEAFGPTREEPEATFTKSTVDGFTKFARFEKLEDTDHGPMVWGVATIEEPDLDNEICSYDDAVDAYKSWSQAAYQRTADAGQEPSLGNVRLQHSTEIGGKVVKVDYDDENKRIMLGSVPFNDQVLSDLRKGYYTGYSQGGSYAWRKCADCGNSLPLQQANNYCSSCKKTGTVRFGLKRLSEVSYVDSPCTGKGFEYVKINGSTEIVNFAKRAGHPGSGNGVQVLDALRIFGNVWKHTVQIGGQKRTVVIRDSCILLIA